MKMKPAKGFESNFVPKLCDDCQHGSRLYSDGYIYRDWSGQFEGDPSTLPGVPDQSEFWTYLECAKNNKGLKHINLDGKCTVFVQRKR